MTLGTCEVSTALDLSRLKRNPLAEIALRRLLRVGREVDLLEALRRTEKKEQLSIEKAIIHATGLGIDAGSVEASMLPLFQEHQMLDIDGEKIILRYTTVKEVYVYAIRRFEDSVLESETKLAQLICRSTKCAIAIEQLDSIIALFSPHFRRGVKDFLLQNSILKTFDHKGEIYVVSPRIYKNEKKFKQAIEILDDKKLGNIVDFIQENPGNPLPVARQYLRTDSTTLELLCQSGIIDPIRLDIRGDTKDYLFSTDILNEREDRGHLDLVRKTLANFRFGEYYSEKKRLYSLDKFFQYMLDHGYAGKAKPVGTDYMNLEWAGVFRIEKIQGSQDEYRFWMLKKDVIQDALSVLRGYVPIQSDSKVGQLSNIESVVQARSLGAYIDADSRSIITKALRDIQEGLTTA